ncbi:MAG TPA: methyl-accepting chemotaxis protein [Pseudolabrys sp.]|nr:methyl-accepting chemotaxis protein [Pseudolabrys sp.]
MTLEPDINIPAADGRTSRAIRVFARWSPASWLTTIRSRLYLAFGVTATLTVMCSLFSLYAFTSIGKTSTQIASRNLPATVQSLRLAEEAADLVATAPRLMAATDKKNRFDVFNEIGRLLDNIDLRITILTEFNREKTAALTNADALMAERLQALDRAVTERISISERRHLAVSNVRKTHEAFLEAITPLIDDANFTMMTADTISKDMGETLRELLEMQSEANLLAGLLVEASLVTESTRLQPLSELIDSARRKVEGNWNKLPFDEAEKLVATFNQFTQLADRDGLIAIRGAELGAQDKAKSAFDATQSAAAQLRGIVDTLVKQEQASVHRAVEHGSQQITSGRTLLLALSVVSMLTAGLVAFFYVGRNIVRRLRSLSRAMHRIADGELDVHITDRGRDEIAHMARTLLVFRQATADVIAARQAEVNRAQDADERRTSIETATANFERAVKAIIDSLSHASTGMDDAARHMSKSAGENQTEAVSAAAAASEATRNVEIVATAADELARSIEHISAQVRGSATVARTAAGETQVISNAVEQLAKSVAEIGSVSSLIRGIAGQTNLLALNATIEAARAGDAGRGFAVVAQEVKGLAAQTSQATEEITRQIQQIEQTTARAIEAMKTVAGTIVRLDATASEVAAAIEQQGGVTQEIARNAGAAAQGTQQVSMNVTQVSQAARTTEQVAQNVLGAAADLSQCSTMLRNEVERFLVRVRAA